MLQVLSYYAFWEYSFYAKIFTYYASPLTHYARPQTQKTDVVPTSQHTKNKKIVWQRQFQYVYRDQCIKYVYILQILWFSNKNNQSE